MSDDPENESDNNRIRDPSLTDEQNDTLQHLQEVISWIETDRAISLLQECDWDLERAVNKFFGGTNTPPDDTTVRRRNTGTDANPPPIALVPPNQRVIRVAQYEYRGWWWALLMLFEPIRLTYHLLFGITRFFTSFLWPDPRNQVTDPVGDVERFIQFFHSTYSDGKNETNGEGSSTIDPSRSASPTPTRLPVDPTMPPFFVGTYAMALGEAKRSLRFLIVYLHGDSHEDTRTFCEKTLRHTEVLQFFHNSDQVILWGCNIKSPEGHRVSLTLREHAYPFIGVIGLTNLAASENGQYSSSMIGMALLGRIEGAVKPIDLIQQLTSILDDNRGATIVARMERKERETRTRIRDEQDLAFQEALEQDRARSVALEEERRMEAEQAAELARSVQREEALREAVKTRRDRWRQCLPPAPPVGTPSTVQLSFKMPNGRRSSRVFSLTDSIKILYYFVLSQDEAPEHFELQANFPKRSLHCQPETESDLEDYLPQEWTTKTDTSNPELKHPVKSLEHVLNWAPESPGDPPTFTEMGLCKPEILFVLDQDA